MQIIALLFILFAESLFAVRLLVNIEPTCSYSAEEFACASGATYLEVDTRNPYKSFPTTYLDLPFVCLSNAWSQDKLRDLSLRYGYRYLVVQEGDLANAVKEAQQILEEGPETSSAIPSLSTEEAATIYRLMDKIDRLFTREELPYWAGGGTLIGAIRHKGLIPWDDDLDLYILEVDEAKLKALDFDSEGLVLHYYWKDLYKIFEKEALLIPDERDPEQISPFRYPAADIFLMTLEKRREKEDMYVHRSFDFYWYWNNDRFHYSQIEDLTRVPFGPFTILIPKEPEAYLDRVYGPYWKSHALEPFWNHKTGAMAPGASLLEIDNFSPALFTP